MAGPAAAAPVWPDGVRLEWLERVDSTNEEALRRAAAGEAGPLWLAATEQTTGRGRRGRSWLSDPDDLKASLLLTPAAFRPGVGAAETATLSFVLGLALADVLVFFAPSLEVRLKWPNDVLADGRKITGLLLESRGAQLALGVGLNLVSRPDAATLERDAWAPAALAEFADPPPTPERALTVLAAAFHARLLTWAAGGFAALRAEWLARAARLGETVSARLPQERIDGRFVDIDETGALVLETETGRRLIHAAEVYFPQAADAPR